MNARELALFEELVNHLHKIAEESSFVRLNLQRIADALEQQT